MSTGEEIAEKIKELGAIIASAKKEKKPIEEWKSSLDEMLALKVRECYLPIALDSLTCVSLVEDLGSIY